MAVSRNRTSRWLTQQVSKERFHIDGVYIKNVFGEKENYFVQQLGPISDSFINKSGIENEHILYLNLIDFQFWS